MEVSVYDCSMVMEQSCIIKLANWPEVNVRGSIPGPTYAVQSP